MKKLLMILAIILSISITGCVGGDGMDSAENTKYQILLNTGSLFAYTFCDEETGVWYISSSKGIMPRLNLDGTLYKK